MSELHLRVFRDKSELLLPDGATQVVLEGGMSQLAKLRYQKISIELPSTIVLTSHVDKPNSIATKVWNRTESNTPAIPLP